jgi:RecA-family ATPase
MNEHGQPIEFSEEAGKIRRLEDIPNIQTIEIPPIDYLVPGMIARNTLNLWAGADGTAKTFLAMRMALAVATGGLFLGRRCQRARVLYLDYENPSFAIRDRMDLMTGGTVAPDLHIWGTWLEQQPPQIGSELLLTIAKDSKPLIIVDPFRYAHGAEENDSTAMMGIMQCLRYCAAAGGAVIVLHTTLPGRKALPGVVQPQSKGRWTSPTCRRWPIRMTAG